MNFGQKPFRYPSVITKLLDKHGLNSYFVINDHQNSIQALGKAIEKGAMFEQQYKMINDNDFQ